MTGDIMAWLNSDDMYCPWALRTVASIMRCLPEVEWLTTLNPLTWTCDGFCRAMNSIPGFSKESFLDGCYLPNNVAHFGWIQQESTFWRRSLWERSGAMVRTEYRLAGDFDLWARFYDHARLFGVTSPLGGFRSQPDQRTRNFEAYLGEAHSALDSARRRSSWTRPRRKRTVLSDIPVCAAGPRETRGTMGRFARSSTRTNTNLAGKLWKWGLDEQDGLILFRRLHAYSRRPSPTCLHSSIS